MIAASGAAGLYDMVGDRFHGNMRTSGDDFAVGIDDERHTIFASHQSLLLHHTMIGIEAQVMQLDTTLRYRHCR